MMISSTQRWSKEKKKMRTAISVSMSFQKRRVVSLPPSMSISVSEHRRLWAWIFEFATYVDLNQKKTVTNWMHFFLRASHWRTTTGGRRNFSTFRWLVVPEKLGEASWLHYTFSTWKLSLLRISWQCNCFHCPLLPGFPYIKISTTSCGVWELIL